ncbi:glutamate racemase, partial [Vibrio sp. 10N.261.49.C12]
MVVSDSLQKNILVFDSGVGGLSVYKEISQLLPNH